MSKPSFSQYMDAVFSPFVRASGNPTWASQLRTADIPVERRDQQFTHLKTLEAVGGPPIPLNSGSFLYRFRHNDAALLCVGTENIDEEDVVRLSEWSTSNNLLEHEYEECLVLFLAYYAKDYFRPRASYLRRSSAEELIGIVDESYVGHDIDEIQKWYGKVSFYSIPPGHIFGEMNNYVIAASLATSAPSLRSNIMPQGIATLINDLNILNNVDPENLYFALTSVHWKHVFVEVYKCIEAAFFLPWVRSLRRAIGGSVSAIELAQHCKEHLKWREKEINSLEELIALVPDELVFDGALKDINCFHDLFGDKINKLSFARRIYKLRNQVVHQFDYENRELLDVDATAWPTVTAYLCKSFISFIPLTRAT